MVKTIGNDKRLFYILAAEARRMGIPFGGHIQDEQISIADALDSGATIIDHIARTSGGLDRRCVRNPNPRYQTATLATCRQAAELLRQHQAWWIITIVDHGTGVRPGAPGLFAAPNELVPTAQSRRISFAEEARFAYCANSALPLPAGSGNWLRDSARFAPTQTPDVPLDTVGILSLPYRADMAPLVLAGTDRFQFSIHAELALMVAEGFPPLAALQAATLNPAKFLHATDSLGTVAPGKLADLVLLDANPLADITNTTTIQAVVADGRYYDRAALDAMNGCQ